MKLVIIILLVILLSPAGQVYGMQIEDYDFGDIQKFLDEEDDTSNVDFSGLIEEIMTGENVSVADGFIKRLKAEIFGEFNLNRKLMVMIILIAVTSAVFVNFSSAFETGTVSKMAILVTRMINVSILISAFGNIISVVEVFLRRLIEFMEVLLPAYIFSVTFSVGTFTAAGLQQMSMLCIILVEKCVLVILLPMVRAYIIMVLIDSVSGRSSFKKLCQLVKKMIIWSNNTMLASVAGLNVIKKMISPYADQTATMTFNKAASLIPGIGNSISGISEVVIGTGSFIRNSIGVAGLIIIAVICLFPLVKMSVFSVMYRLCGALLEPVADERVVEGITSVGDGVAILIKISFTGALMLMLTIGIICI